MLEAESGYKRGPEACPWTRLAQIVVPHRHEAIVAPSNRRQDQDEPVLDNGEAFVRALVQIRGPRFIETFALAMGYDTHTLYFDYMYISRLILIRLCAPGGRRSTRTRHGTRRLA